MVKVHSKSLKLTFINQTNVCYILIWLVKKNNTYLCLIHKIHSFLTRYMQYDWQLNVGINRFNTLRTNVHNDLGVYRPRPL